MVLDNLPIGKVYAGVEPALDNLLSFSKGAKLARDYLLAGKVEGKSPKTLETYSMILRRFAAFSRDLTRPMTSGSSCFLYRIPG